MNVTAASTAGGASIVQWPFGTEANDQWRPVRNADGSYQFCNRNSKLLLDDPGGAKQGTQMDQQGANGTAKQSFKLIEK